MKLTRPAFTFNLLRSSPDEALLQSESASPSQAAAHQNAKARGYPIALLAAAILSTTAIFIRHLTLTYQVPALVLAFWRDVFVVITLLPVLLIIAPRLVKINRADGRYLIAYGFVLAIFNSLWTLSVAMNGAAVATVLVYCSAAFTALLGRWLLKEPLGWVKWLAVALSLGGCLLVSGANDPAAWQANLGGLLVGIFSGLSYASYSLMGRSASQRGLSPWTTLLYTFAFAAVFLLAANLLPSAWLGPAAKAGAGGPQGLLWLGTAYSGWLVLFLLAAIPTVLGFGMYNVSLSYLPSSTANLIVTLEPPFTAVTAYLLLGERLTLEQIAGAALIMAGVVFLRMFEEKTQTGNGKL